MSLNFNNTTKAFAYKSNRQLQKARFLFKLMQIGPIVSLGTKITPWAIKIGLPIKGIIRKTLFEQFVGGESLEKTEKATKILAQYGVKVILDYGVEGGEQNQEKLEKETNKFIEVIQFASKSKNIPYISIKITGLAPTSLLEKLNCTIGLPIQPISEQNIEKKIEELTPREKQEWENLLKRINFICQEAEKKGIGVMIDAEESWIQDPIDHLAYIMMKKFNQNKAVVFNTIQLYRNDRLEHLKQHLNTIEKDRYISGLKLVRGAYMEKERARAEKFGYPSPIQPDKISTDLDYDEAVKICLQKKHIVATIIASHNEKSTLLAASMQNDDQNVNNHESLHFSQLYGMSDNLTFNLADAGYSVSKYLPFGPIHEVIPYLMRRAQENSSVSGQTGRELELIDTEWKRRKG
jgi:proline dehydrogenase